MTRFLLIRHAATATSGKVLAGRIAGLHLSEAGRRQAQVMATRLADVRMDAIYSSPLDRARETAQPLATARGLEVQTSEDFLEIAFGDWTNRTFAELAGEPLFQRFNVLRSVAPVPGGEYMLQAQLRMVTGLEKLRARHPDGTVAVVGHGDPIKAAVAYYAGIPLDLFQRIEIGLASVSIVETGDDTIRIVAVNSDGGVPPRN